ncbi:hypothetical protein KUV57_12750 [Epibacterium sp. DP7N7-1]|nr:hypothetical protein [Epibacterium sp. DP7N7-1]
MTKTIKRLGNVTELSPAALRSNTRLATELQAIKDEGFSPEQLLQARKTATDMGLRFINGLDAVRVLREAGAQVQSAPPKRDRLPELAGPDDVERGYEQAELARRKARRAAARLGAFVLAPTLGAAIYFTQLATPIFATHSEFVIQKPDQAGVALTGPGAAMAGSALAGNQDAISVQGYLTSRAAFEEMDRTEGFTAHFSDPSIDIFHRIPAGASSEQVYRSFSRHVDVSFDPTEGVMRMRVEAADPQISQDISLRLLELAEAHLDQMTAKLRDDQVATAIAAKQRADAQVSETQAALIDLQESFSVLSGDLEMGLLQKQIGRIEAELTDARLMLAELRATSRPNTSRLDTAERRVRLLENSLAEKRAQITATSREGVSVARVQGEIAVLQAELASSQQVQTESILSLERARSEAGRQVRYLALGVEPVLPGAPEFPRPIIHTLMAFGAFLGIYLLASVTLNLIREQILK